MGDVYKSNLDHLFRNALEIIEDLSRGNKQAEFTSQDFIKSIARHYSFEYLDLLMATRNHLTETKGEDYARKWLFNLAHQAIGKRLRKFAEENGYQYIDESKDDETDIWGNPTGRKTYRKHTQ